MAAAAAAAPGGCPRSAPRSVLSAMRPPGHCAIVMRGYLLRVPEAGPELPGFLHVRGDFPPRLVPPQTSPMVVLPAAELVHDTPPGSRLAPIYAGRRRR